MDKKGLQIRIWLFAASLISMLWGFRLLVFKHAPEAFSEPLEDMSYGWYVPVFSLYVVWQERRKILSSLGTPSAWGLLPLVVSLFIGFLGVRGLQIRFEILGFVGVLLSLAWCLFGLAAARQVLFPAVFLLFCMPLHTYLDIVTIHLRMLAVAIAHGVLAGCGSEVVRQGTMLFSPTGAFAIDVAAPCSGMRSLFAMMALTAGYAYFTQPTWLRRVLLFALSIPIAIAGNVVRILTIVGVAATCSPSFATGFYHDYSGYVVFLVAILFMVAAGSLITKGAERCARQTW